MNSKPSLIEHFIFQKWIDSHTDFSEFDINHKVNGNTPFMYAMEHNEELNLSSKQWQYLIENCDLGAVNKNKEDSFSIWCRSNYTLNFSSTIKDKLLQSALLNYKEVADHYIFSIVLYNGRGNLGIDKDDFHKIFTKESLDYLKYTDKLSFIVEQVIAKYNKNKNLLFPQTAKFIFSYYSDYIETHPTTHFLFHKFEHSTSHEEFDLFFNLSDKKNNIVRYLQKGKLIKLLNNPNVVSYIEKKQLENTLEDNTFSLNPFKI